MSIIQRIGDFIDAQKISIRAFEQSISASNGLMRKALTNNTDIQTKWLSLIVENYPQINTEWLLTGNGPMLKEEDAKDEVSSCVMVPNKTEFIKIPIVDISVAAGSGCYNSDCPEEIECITLPRSMVKNGRTYLCVRVKGQSMTPSILDGGYLIVQLLDRSEWVNIRDSYVYVVSDNEGRAYVKRLKNRLLQHGFIVCMSDNADKHNYANFNLHEEEINTVWFAEWYFTARIPNIQESYYRKQAELEDRVDELSAKFQQLTKELHTPKR